MNMNHTDRITLGRDPGLTYAVLNALAERRAKDEKAARRKAECCRFAKKMIDTLRFWK
jgi:hypothetical protein